MSDRLSGLGITEVECYGCGERIDYSALEDVSKCPECGQPWRVVSDYGGNAER